MADDFWSKRHCDWCKRPFTGCGSTMSKFSTDAICCVCKNLEEKHPKYAEADKAECDAVLAGERNFPGIGVPPDLIDDAVILRTLVETAEA